METKDTGENKTVINIFSNHFNAHPLIPDNNGTYRSAQHIHPIVPEKCIPGAVPGIIFGYGLIYG
jgi:hypothetical protein